MLGFGPRLHVFTAGSQDVNNRFVASQLLYGSPLALPVPDVLRTDLLVVIGANPIVSHGSVLTVPRIKDRMHDIVKRGGRVLVIDPRKTETAAQFEWLGIVPDGDAYLLLSLLHVLFAENLADRATAGTPGRRRRLARAARPAVQPRGHRAAHRHRPGHRARAGPRPGPHPSGPRCTAASAPAPAKTARSQRICSMRSTWSRATSTVPGGSMFGRFGHAGRALAEQGRRRAAAHQLHPQALADRRLPVGARVRARGRDGQGDHHTGSRSGPGAVRQRRQPGAVGAQRRRTGGSAATAWS